MGVLLNFSVYGLMIIPLAALVKGHRITISSLVKLSLVMATVQLAQSAIATAAPPDMAVAQVFVHGALLPLITVAFCNLVLTDAKALKVMRLHHCGNDDDAGATVATLWCLVNTILFRWFPWYYTMASRGFEPDNLLAGVEAFLTLLTTLAMCRSFASGTAVATVAAVCVHVVGAVVGAVTGLPTAGMALTAALECGAAKFVSPAPRLDKRGD
ncbi:hypothetical protein ABL78_3289 [Leptomonas seymouri]|uniref:Uncharacterized protein n=1 Tax=Leptomonas seymouri TaxID=5684 RepID=A0A0N1HZR4_LEPSE|nr:hypothetical protein ABL78_3289 [Leptomonas seymouri]|eukprot:KPI87632.1 hypothetical protein ABL78_3289 [Leptomonas seymouri]